MHDARNNSGHMHDAQALAMHDARNEKNAMHVHTICKNPMIGARKKGMGTLYDLFRPQTSFFTGVETGKNQ